MKIFFLEFIVIITTYFIDFTVSEDFEIFRVSADGSNGWTKSTDTFKLPSSLCGPDGSDSAVNCARFGAKVKRENGQMCFCSCPNENATLMYQKGEWECWKNSVVRELLGYDQRTYIYFDNENKGSELRMLNISDDRRVSLSWRLSQCRVHEESSLAIGCNGSKVPFDSTLFTIERRGFRHFLKVNNSSPSHSDPIKGRIIQLGIRCVTRFLGFPIYRRLLFKYEGKLTCSISVPTVQPSVTTRPQTTLTLSPSPIARTTSVATNKFPPITSRIIPTVSDIPTTASDAVSNTPSTGSDVRPTVSVTSPTIYEVRPTVSDSPPTFNKVHPTVSDPPSITYDVYPTISEIHPTASNAPSMTPVTTTLSSSNAPPRPNPGSEQRTEKRSSSLALIAPVLAIVVIVGFLVYRRRYAKPKSYSSTRFEGMKEPGDESVIYKELDFKEQPVCASHHQVPNQSSETHFIENYPTTDLDHIYEPLNFNTLQHICRAPKSHTHDNDLTSLNQDRRPISVQQPLYNLMEELTLRGAEGPIQNGAWDDDQSEYDDLEEPYLEPVDEPVDNKSECDNLEEPYLKGPEGGGQYGAKSSDEPVDNQSEYDDLREPYLEGSEGVDQYGAKSSEEPVDNQSEYDDLEEPYLEGSEGLKQHGAMSPEEPVDDQSEYDDLEEPYLKGSEGVDQYGAMSTKEPVYHTLEKPCVKRTEFVQ